MKVFSVTDKGRVRQINEDYYYLPEPGENFAAIADGMGGHAAGEVASYTAVSVMAKTLRKASGKRPQSAIQDAFETANEKVYLEASGNSERSGMGTTLTVVMLDRDTAYLGHVGDSRAYRLRNGHIEQMSVDHSYVEELVRNGIITREQARTHPKRNIITRCIGVYAAVEVDISAFERRTDDVWLLCSDGLSGYVNDEEMEKELNLSGKSWQEKLNSLKDLALERGGADNITALIVTGGQDE